MQRKDRHIDRWTRHPDRPRQRRVERPANPGPSPTKAEPNNSAKDGTSNQKLMLFIRGNAMSGEPIISGTIQLPKPPIIAGMTVKKIMIRPWAVIRTL